MPPLSALLSETTTSGHHPFSPARAALRDSAFSFGLPNASQEDWRWSRLAQALPSAPFVAPDTTTTTTAPRFPTPPTPPWDGLAQGGDLIFLNGTHDPASHLAGGITLSARDPDATNISPASPFPALAHAFAPQSLAMHVAANGTGTPAFQGIRLLGAGAGLATHAAARVSLAPSAALDCVMQSCALDSGARLLNTDWEFRLEAGAHLRLILLEDETPACFRLARLRLWLGRGATAEVVHLTRGSHFSRLELEVDLAAPQARCILRGAAALARDHRLDGVLRVRHAVADTHSEERFRAAVAGGGEHCFQGRVTIDPGADGADAAMESKSLLLEEDARSRNKPELEIFHDNVACSHGVAVSPPPADALFYLRSRGFSESRARRLTVGAFLAEATARPAHGEGEGAETQSWFSTLAARATEAVAESLA